MRRADPDRALSEANAAELLERIPWPELQKRVRGCDEIEALTKLVNLSLKKLRSAPLWDTGWRSGHYSKQQLNECVEEAEDRIQILNDSRMQKLRERSFLDNLLPQYQSEQRTHGKAKQGPSRRGRRRRLGTNPEDAQHQP